MKGKSGYITGIYNPNAFNGSIWKINYCQSKRCPSQSECQNSADIGDMRFAKNQTSVTAKTGESAFVPRLVKLWDFAFENSKYIVPYRIDKKFVNNHRGKTELEKAFQKLQSNSSLKFIERTNQESYLYFIDGHGCKSYVGQQSQKAPNKITLGSGCWFYYTIIHEVSTVICRNKTPLLVPE